MKEQKAAFVFTGYEFADENGIGTGKIVHVPTTINYKEALKNTTIFTSTVMFDMEQLPKEELQMPQIKSEDTALWWRILRGGTVACGLDENPNKKFDGGRPSSLIYGDNLNPKSLGALLAHFENKVMFQGFVWNVNSFDQEGVQLGKVLAKTVLSGKMEGALKAYANLLIK